LRPTGGGDYVPFFVQAHAVDTTLGISFVGSEGVKRIVLAQGTVIADGVCSEFTVYACVVTVALCDIEGLAVYRYQYPVGHCTVGLYPRHDIAAISLRSGAKHSAETRFFYFGLVYVGCVPGVGEPYTTLSVYG
jgi:hypothetical protein